MSFSAPRLATTKPLYNKSTVTYLAAIVRLLALVVALFLFNARRAAHRITVVNRDGSQSVMDLAKLKERPVLDVNTGAALNFNLSAPHTLLVFFSPSDCVSCLDEARVWQDISGDYDAGRVKVIGLLVKTSLNEARTFIRAYHSSFPLYLDYCNDIPKNIGLPHETPFKVLVDSDWKVLFADGPNFNEVTQIALREKIARILKFSPASR